MEVMQQGKYYSIVVQSRFGRMRLDKFLALHIEQVSRTKIQKAITTGNVTVNDRVVTDNKYQVKSLDKIIYCLNNSNNNHYATITTETIYPQSSNTSLQVIYEDHDLLVIDKPPYLLTHPGAGNHGYTMVDILVNRYGKKLSDIGGQERLGIVHRLDKNTSGLLLVAKNNYVHMILAREIANRNVERHYQAIVYGMPQYINGSVIANIGRSKRNRTKMTVMQVGGKHAVTHYKVLEKYGNGAISLLQCKLDTGRTHQIRVHLNFLKTPIVGDKLYIAAQNFNLSSLEPDIIQCLKNTERQMLHARYLEFNHPITGKSISLESKLPTDMATLLAKLNHHIQ